MFLENTTPLLVTFGLMRLTKPLLVQQTTQGAVPFEAKMLVFATNEGFFHS